MRGFVTVLIYGEKRGTQRWQRARRTQRRGGWGEWGGDEDGRGVKNVERGEEGLEPSPRPSPIRMGEGGR